MKKQPKLVEKECIRCGLKAGWFKLATGLQVVADFPDIDLNNLFRYAVPKLIEKLVWGKYVELMKRWLDTLLFCPEGRDPALALFWTI